MTSNGWEQENNVDGLEQYSSTLWDRKVQKESVSRFVVHSETSKDMDPWDIRISTLDLY